MPRVQCRLRIHDNSFVASDEDLSYVRSLSHMISALMDLDTCDLEDMALLACQLVSGSTGHGSGTLVRIGFYSPRM